MLKRRKLMSRSLALLALPAFPTGAQPRVLQGLTEDKPPLNFVDDAGQPSGLSVELLRLMANEAGLGLTLTVLPWARALQAAPQTPDSVLFSLVRLPEREREFQWVGPIGPRRVMIYKLAQRNDIRFQGLSNLQGLRLGVMRHSAIHKQLIAEGLNPQADLEFGKDDATNMRKLIAGRMDLVALVDWTAQWHLTQLKMPPSTLTMVKEYGENYGFWFGLHPATDPAVQRSLQAALDKLKREGRFDALRQKYLPK